MPTTQQLLAQHGLRIQPVPDLHHVHPECLIELPSDVNAEIALFQRFRLGAFSHLNGGFIKDVSIGRYCSFARDVQIGHGFHPVDWLSVSPLQYTPHYRDWMRFCAARQGREQVTQTMPFVWQDHTTIGNDVWLGNHVVVKDGVTIGDGVIVGANAVVTRDVPPYAIVVGNPGRVLRLRFDERTVERLLALQWWSYSIADFGAVAFNDIHAALDRIEQLVADGLQPYTAPCLDAEALRRIQATSNS